MPVARPDTLESLRTAAIAATLHQCRLFAGLANDELETVAEGCSTRSLAKGEVLFREGDRADGFYVVRTGSISVQRTTSEGREQVICVFGPNESFAEVTLATVETYPADAVALESSQVILVRRAPFRDLVCRRPELALRMLTSMSLHLKHLVQTLHDFKGRQVEARLASWLLQHSPVAGSGCPAVVELGMTKKVLASQLGVTSETLSRTFARFRDEGLIRVTGPRVHLLDGAGLSAYATASK